MRNNFELVSMFLLMLCFPVIICFIPKRRFQGILKDNVEHVGEQLSNGLITIVAGESFRDCISLCQRRSNCLSINYVQTLLVCELNFLDKSDSNSLFVRNPNSLYTEKGSWRAIPNDPCSGRQCRENEKCVPKVEGQTLCVTSDCGEYPQNTTEAIPTGGGIGVYSKVTYHCTDSYILRGKPHEGCQANGVWSPKQFQCLGCPENWTSYKKHCYLISSSTKDWKSMKSYCHSNGAELAEITSKEENGFLENFIREQGKLSAWVGGSDTDHEGIWKWTSSGTIFLSHLNDAYNNFHSNQPDNAGGSEHCLQLLIGWWNDGKCVSNLYGICEKPLAV